MGTNAKDIAVSDMEEPRLKRGETWEEFAAACLVRKMELELRLMDLELHAPGTRWVSNRQEYEELKDEMREVRFHLEVAEQRIAIPEIDW